MKLIPVIVKIEGHSEYIVGYQCVRDSWLLPESNEMFRMALERALPKDRTTKNKFNIHLVQYNGFEFVRTYLSVVVGVGSTSRIRYSNDAQLADLLLGKQPYQDQLFYELTKVRGLMTPDSSAIGLIMLARQGHVDAINELKHVYHRKEIEQKTFEMIIPTLRDVANAGSKEAALALAEILRRSHHKDLAQEYYTKAKQLKPAIQAKYQKYTVFLPAIRSAQTLQSKSASQEYKEQKILADPIKQLLLGFECKQNFEKLKNSKGRSHHSKQLQCQAFTHFSEAANAHDIEAQYQLSLCYRTGFGVRIDVNEADRLLNLAAKSGHKQAHEIINSGYLQKVGQLLARVFCRRPAVSKISQVQIEVKEQIVEQKRADTLPRKNKRAQQDAKTDIDQESETTSDVSESTSHTLLKQLKPRYPQSKEKKGKSNYLCELLGIIKHCIDDDDWTAAFNEIERIYNSKKISSARSTILNDLVKELVNAYPKKFGKFLIELASREKHVDLFKYVFGLTLHNKIKQLVSDKLVIYHWIKAKLDADIEIYAILDAIKTYHHDKKPDSPLQTELVDVLQQAKVEVLKAHQSDSFVNQQVAALDILPCYTEKQKALFKPKEPEQLATLFEQLRNAVSQQPERKQIDEVKPKASIAVASVAQHVESSVEAVETKIHPLTIAQKEKQKCIPLLSKITIPPDAAWLMQMIRTTSKYRVRLKGSRVYNPVVDEVDDLRRDIDLETDAPWELITLLLWAYKEIQVNVMNVGTEGASIELCKFKGWSKGHSIDIHCSADLEYVCDDMIHRMVWADENGNCYGMTSNADNANKMKVLAFTCDSKQFFINNPARILSTVLALSNGFKFSAEENEMHIANLKAALPALAELAKTRPERLLFPLLKNFTRGNAVENVRLLHSFGVFNALFPTTELDKDEQEFVIGEHKKIFMTFDSAYKTGLHFSLWNLYGRILAAYLRPVMAMTPEVIDKALDDKIAEMRMIGCQTKRLAEIKAFAKKYLIVMHKRHQTSLVTNAKNRHIAGEVSKTGKDVPQQSAVAVSLSVEHKM